jgi:hypothetical protein
MATLIGESDKGNGVEGRSNAVFGIDPAPAGAGVLGVCKANIGVKGVSETGTGVDGVSPKGFGVAGESDTSLGVLGLSNTGNGVEGRSNARFGIDPAPAGAGVLGVCKANIGVKGVSETGTGVDGVSPKGFGVAGESDTSLGVLGLSKTSNGVEGRSESGIGVVGKGGRLAGRFEGDVEVTGDIRLVNAGDCAEEFDVVAAESIEPGTVMVLSKEGGALHQSQQAYDKRVAGVISGAGGYKPGIVLDKRDTQTNRVPLALLGKVYCKVDASCGPIEVGDLLTSSDRPGHAMTATEPLKAFGSIIGKALQPLKEGQGLIPILVALQ